MEIPESSPVHKAIIANPKTIAHEQNVLRKAVTNRIENAVNAIELIGKLAVYNPTMAQRDAMLNALRNAVSQVEHAFGTVQARQIEFDLPDGDN